MNLSYQNRFIELRNYNIISLIINFILYNKVYNQTTYGYCRSVTD